VDDKFDVGIFLLLSPNIYDQFRVIPSLLLLILQLEVLFDKSIV